MSVGEGGSVICGIRSERKCLAVIISSLNTINS